jgi:hypothetical protein
VLWRIDELVLLLASFAALLAAIEVGFRLGVRHSDRSMESDKTHFGALQASVLGLLALLLGFTFFMAVSRFEARKSLVIDEANAIGTTYLRSQLLPAEQRDAAKELFRKYVAARLSFYSAGIDQTRIELADAEATRIQARLWALAGEAAALDPRSVPAGLFSESLNDVIDIHEKRQAALDNHVPEAVLHLLLAVSLVSVGLVGYGGGLNRRRRPISNALFALLVVFVLTTIIDIDRPRRGFIEVSQESLIRLQATLERDAR